MTFYEWLLSNHYSATTVRRTIPDLGRAVVALRTNKKLDMNARTALRRYMSFADAKGLRDDIVMLASRAQITPVQRLPTEMANERVLEARSFQDDDWTALLAHVKGSTDPRDITLAIMGSTSLRVGDTLRINRNQVAAALPAETLMSVRKGGRTRPMPLGIMEPWQLLHTAFRQHPDAWNVASLICPTNDNPEANGCAYQRVNRRLKSIGKALGLEGRVHLHRMRRTLAVHALEETDNTTSVQNMLGHATPKTTMKYIDEVNVNKQRKLQRKLAGLEG